MVRHATRYIQQSMGNVVERVLVAGGWMGDSPPFGARPVVLERRQPKTSELRPVTDNTVFVSFGPEDSVRDRQLGGGLLEREYILFVDILGQSDAVALAIASDVKDHLEGLDGLGGRYLRPVDPRTNALLPGFVGEWEDVVREQANPELASWQAVKATLPMVFPGDVT